MHLPQHRLFEQAWPPGEGEFRLFQLGFVVDDVLAAADRWAAVFGVGPFHVLPRMEVECTLHGEPGAVDMQVAVAQAGPVQIELIQQHCDRPSIYREAAGRGRNVFHQLCTVTGDYDGRVAHYQGLGYELASEVRTRTQRVAFLDAVEDFGFYIEVVDSTPGFLEQLAAIDRTCAEWDGTDPVRILTRDGYRPA